MKKRKALLLLLVATLFLQSCVCLFTPINPRVTVVSKTKDATIFMDGKMVGKDSVRTRVKLPDSHEIKITKYGYKDKRFYFVAQRGNWRYALDLHPLFLLIDIAAAKRKHHLYPKKFVVDEMREFPVKTPDLKYMFVQEVNVNLEKGSSNLKSFRTYKRYLKGVEFRAEKWKEPVQYDNSSLSVKLNEIVNRFGFSDSSKSIIKSRINTTYVRCNLTKIEFVEVRKGMIFQLKLNFNWELYDYYQKKIYEASIESLSDFDTYYVAYNEWGMSTSNNSGKVDYMIDDVLENSVIDLLAKPEVIALLKTNKDQVEKERAANKEILLMNYGAKKEIQVPQLTEQVVYIKDGKAKGSGCVVSEDGFILTTVSNIPLKDTFDVYLSKKKYRAYVVRRDDETNVALLKSNIRSNNPVRINTGKQVDVADDVYVIAGSTSEEFSNSVSKGIISGKRKFSNIEYLQTDASFNPGSCGGPLLSAEGELIGLVLGKITGSGLEGLGFCVPSRYILERLKISAK